MTQLTCARCGKRFEPDLNHVEIEASTKRMQDRNGVEIYYMHEECWIRHTEKWDSPV